MNKPLLFVFVFSFFCIDLSAQINVEGLILFDNKPVEDVTIFLNNTSIGTITNKNGEFSLDIEEGSYQLIISHIGYRTIEYALNTSDYTKPLVFSLSEEKFALDEVIVSVAKNNEDRQNHLNNFRRSFIGTSKFSKQCTILNPDVLIFDYDIINNNLTAEATQPLHIKNKALGYEIHYDLEHFSTNNKYVKYLGYSYFKELEGRKHKRKKWRKNRLKAYHGSPIHFFKSVLKNTAKKEGFIIHQFARKENKERLGQTAMTTSKKLFTPPNATDFASVLFKKTNPSKYVDYLYNSDIPASDIVAVKDNNTYLQFNDNLSIVYTNEKEEEGYILRNGTPRKALPQTSNIIPVAKKSIIHPTGILEDPLSVIYEGYWSYEKFAHSLPLDYDPI